MCCPPALSEWSLPESQVLWSAVLGTGLGTVVTPGWPQDRAGSTSTVQVLLKQSHLRAQRVWGTWLLKEEWAQCTQKGS